MKEILKGIVFTGIFILPFIPLFVADSMFFPFITGKNFAFRIIVEIIFAAWVLLALYDPKYRPRFSWISVSFVVLVVIMFFADLFGVFSEKSFWSNFERMEGFVTLAHLLLYFLVLGAVMTERKYWMRLFNVSLFAALIMVMYAFRQLAGDLVINQGGVRVDGTLGNATYLAIYMLFHTFIALIMLVWSKVTWQRVLYAVLALIYVYILVQTATRGAILGLAGGLVLSGLYIAFFEKEQVVFRRIAFGTLAFVIVIAGVFYTVRDTEYVKNDPILSRLATISLESGETRFTIWGMAVEGVKQRPLLGWGQGNFNYVFNKEYEPSLYLQEQWFDRVHNIILDWLVAGGVLGLLAYLALFVSTIWLGMVRPLCVKKEKKSDLSVPERGLLLGLLGAYFVHNLFVFDNIVSYMLFVLILALVHTIVSKDIVRIKNMRLDPSIVTQIAIPVVVVTFVFSAYFVNIPHMKAAWDLIDTFGYVNAAHQNPQLTNEQRNELFVRGVESLERALGRNSFGDQEIREQIVRVSQGVIANNNVSQEIRNRYLLLAEQEVRASVEDKPNDARVRVFASAFYRSTGRAEEALAELEKARELSPRKQQILFELGFVHQQLNQYEEAHEPFKQAFELDENFERARIYYAVSAIYNNDFDTVDAVITPAFEERYINDERVMRALYTTNQYERTDDLLMKRIAAAPNDAQLRVSRAFLKNEAGATDEAIAILVKAIEDIPAFKEQGETFIQQLNDGTVTTGQ